MATSANIETHPWEPFLPEGAKNTYAMVGFRIGNTLSESGTVSRGLCTTNENHLLTSVVERTKIQRIDGEVKYIDDNGEWAVTEETTPVSMNFWGFTPDYFKYSEDYFIEFLKNNINNLTILYGFLFATF